MTSEKVQSNVQLEPYAMHYNVEVDPADAVEAATLLPEYNNATPERLVNLINSIGEMTPTMQYYVGNPNNGLPLHKFIIGREYSRVLRLQIPKRSMPDILGRHWVWMRYADDLSALGREARADEMTIISNEEDWFEFRFWWD